MKKLLYVVPHLSTGGMPQYLLKQIETFKNDYKIIVVEYNNVSNDFVVQKNKIKDICEVITIGEHKSDLYGIINKEKANIVHFQEIPESFVSTDILNKIFVQDRKYDLVITTHSSYTEPSQLLYLPDKFLLVSEWSLNKFKSFFEDKVECDLWEYPIEKVHYDKIQAKQNLGFDLEYKHVLHVGLFTDGKNQGHIFELARMMSNYKILFHFVGNQAMNFEFYWGPLMENKPDNCIVHGEKENVSDYYKASDCFYFPSRWELNPISVIEALGFGLPAFITKLHTYANQYDGLVEYISDSMEDNMRNLIRKLSPSKKDNKSPQNIYSIEKRNPNLTNDIFVVNFVDGPYLEIRSSDTSSKYKVLFINKTSGEVEYSDTINSNCWVKSFKKYFIDWHIQVYKEDLLVFEHNYDCSGKRVMISVESKSLGDSLAWIAYADEFRKIHDCTVVLSSFHNDIVRDFYPDLLYSEPGTEVKDLYALYRIGWFYNDEEIDYSKLPIDPRKGPLQKTASSILGLPYVEVITKIPTYKNIVSNFETYDSAWLKSISKEIFDDKEYEHEGIKINPGDIVVDLGANIGIFTAYALSKGASKVYAAEPFAKYVNLLEENTKRWSDKISIIPYGISSSSGQSKIRIGSDSNTIIDSVFDNYSWDKPQDFETIINITLSELFKSHSIDKVNFLKFDIEGSEYDAFKGITDKELKRVEKIAIEYHWNYNNQKDEIISRLSKCNFTVFEFETNSVNKVGKIFAKNNEFVGNKKQIAIGIHSTAQAKYWNNPDGWQQLVDYLNDKGYIVKLLSKEGDSYMGNFHPKGIEHLPAGDLQGVIEELQKSEMFIGIGSGLSWLSWATETQTVIISGFSEPYSEFFDNCIRISAPEDSCSGCYNRYKLDAGDWNWCPDHKNTPKQFECSKKITAQNVISKIDKLI